MRATNLYTTCKMTCFAFDDSIYFVFVMHAAIRPLFAFNLIGIQSIGVYTTEAHTHM